MNDFFHEKRLAATNYLVCAMPVMGRAFSTHLPHTWQNRWTLEKGKEHSLSLPIHITLEIEMSTLCHMKVKAHYNLCNRQPQGRNRVLYCQEITQ